MRTRISPALVREIGRLYADERMTLAAIASRLGISVTSARRATESVRRRLALSYRGELSERITSSPIAFAKWRSAWIADTTQVAARRERTARVAELYLDGTELREIAAATGTPIGSLTKIIRAAGIAPMRRQREEVWR